MGLQMKLGYQLLFAIMSVVIATIPQAASAKCMERAALAGGQTTGAIVAVAPDGNSSNFDAAGYKEVACGTIDKAAYRARVCNPGAIGNHGIQHQLELQAGLTFAQLCDNARQEAGLPSRATDSTARAEPKFMPSNRRPAVTRQRPALVGPLGGGVASIHGQGN